MSLFIVGDVHGCLEQLDQRLEQVGFDPKSDRLWSVGDLVGKGPDSLAVLQRVHALGDRFNMVLGNHEIRLLALMAGARMPADATLQPIVEHASAPYWQQWLLSKPLILRDPENSLTLTHAGVFPGWNRHQAEAHAQAASDQLRSGNPALLQALALSPYKSRPFTTPELAPWVDIINAFTQMRHCDVSGLHGPRLSFYSKSPGPSDPNLVPWYELWPPQTETWLFGHWSDLQGNTGREDICCLDTGCVYGGELSVAKMEAGRLIRL